ncbi:MAG TPA: PqqD family peptide modification chaperone [Solirubrobacteraceae bacterium]|nr:PqqD family peptide modification chaperone [Solirubrobacteraceae bacterium]
MTSVLMRAEHADVQWTGEAVLLVDRAARSAFRLDDVAAAIAEALAGPTTRDAVCERVRGEFAVSAEDCSTAVAGFVDDLERRGLVEAFAAPAAVTEVRRRYLDLLARALVNLIYPEHELRVEHLERCGPEADRVAQQRLMRDIRAVRADDHAELVAAKREGRVWRGRPSPDAHTMVGLRRLENLERCATRIFADGVPGDFLEAGVCQGGASIFLRALQVAYDEPDRATWLADSFAGVPAPSHPVDVADRLDLSEPVEPWLAADRRSVEENFATYGLLSDRVRFLPGWFADSLPDAPVEQIALLRLDADLYSSTREALDALYDRVPPGGYVVVDDYGALAPCRRAVDAFRAERGVAAELRWVDWTGVFWRKGG